MTFGYDLFNDKRFANNHQSGSDYRILGTSSIIQGTGASSVIYPQFLGDGTTIIQVTHSESNAQYGNRIIKIRDGWIVDD